MNSLAPLQPESVIPPVRPTTDIPAVRERVRLTRGNGVYVVVAVDGERKKVL